MVLHGFEPDELFFLLFASDSKILQRGSVAEAMVENPSHSNMASWEVTLLTASDFSLREKS